MADGFKNISAVDSGEEAIAFLEATERVPDIILEPVRKVLESEESVVIP